MIKTRWAAAQSACGSGHDRMLCERQMGAYIIQICTLHNDREGADADDRVRANLGDMPILSHLSGSDSGQGDRIIALTEIGDDVCAFRCAR
jgi:hypothetical protein